ncbi:MAG TPA: hypothetical protein VLW52_16415 [Opitutaceae bacterium]|nr:hypothetical protein [Opitutaceae bacterium]
MKPNACLLKPALLAALLGIAGPLLAENATPVPSVTAKPQGNTSAAAVAKKPAPPEPEGKISGLAVARPNGGFLGILVEEGKFKISFFDAKKKPVPVDVARATARWPVHYKVYDERAVLNPTADGMALTSPPFVRPPYIFKLYLSLFVEGSEDAVENYVVDFRQ